MATVPNPPAFPRPYFTDSRGQTITANPGMDLRDWFAGQALAGLLADPEVGGSCAAAAEVAYSYANAMLAERAKDGAK